MIINIYSDAACKQCHAGWAVFIHSKAGTIKESGNFILPENKPNSAYAELYAILKGLHLSVHKFGNNITRINIYTDNQAVVGWMQTRHIHDTAYKSKREYVQLRIKAKKYIQRIKKEYNIVLIKTMHIRGHQYKNKNISAWINNYCDHRAKYELNKAIANENK